MIWIIIILSILLVLAVIWGFKRGTKLTKVKKNLDVLVDHQNTSIEVQKIQNMVKSKIIEAKNEKQTDAVIKHIFSVANNSKL